MVRNNEDHLNAPVPGWDLNKRERTVTNVKQKNTLSMHIKSAILFSTIFISGYVLASGNKLIGFLALFVCSIIYTSDMSQSMLWKLRKNEIMYLQNKTKQIYDHSKQILLKMEKEYEDFTAAKVNK